MQVFLNMISICKHVFILQASEGNFVETIYQYHDEYYHTEFKFFIKVIMKRSNCNKPHLTTTNTIIGYFKK